MADLSPIIDPIAAAIYQQHEIRESKEPPRGYAGASSIGKECARMLWYSFRWAVIEQFDGRMLRLFQTGHLAEPRFAAELRSIGAIVHEYDPATGKQFAYADYGGHARGHCDGMASNLPGGGKKVHVVEYKTHSAKSFKILAEKKVKEAKPEHYAQMTWYAGQAGVDRMLYLAVNKDTDELHSERLEFDPVFYQQIQAKFERVIFDKTPPPKIATDMKAYACKFCVHIQICHNHHVPAVNCRTCVHSTPERQGDGRWSCAKWGSDIPIEYQRTGCPYHLHQPFFLTYAAPVDAGDGWIEYERLNNKTRFVVLVDGQAPPAATLPHYSSHEIAAAKDHRAICDPSVEEIKTKYPGTTIAG